MLLSACASTTASREHVTAVPPSATVLLPEAPRATLVLFPCFSCDAADTQAESAIPEEALRQDVAVVLMELNGRVFLSEQEVNVLSDTLEGIVRTHRLEQLPVVLGGFSSGGNVATLLAKDLVTRPRGSLDIRGLFVVDSPLDLAHLYRSAERHVDHPVEAAAQEARMVVRLLDTSLGDPQDSIACYRNASPIGDDREGLAPLLPLAVRLYTEPDTTWWREQRGYAWEELNAARLVELDSQLKAMGHARCELILTEGRGVQRGVRHPHAWSIVEEEDLVRWVLRSQ